MYSHRGVKTDERFPNSGHDEGMGAGDPDQLTLGDKAGPSSRRRPKCWCELTPIAICATDLEIIYHGPPSR